MLPLFARDLGAAPALIGFVMGASTLTGIVLKACWWPLWDTHACFQILAVVGFTMAGVFVFATRSRPVTDLP